jgi:hypothetical protein
VVILDREEDDGRTLGRRRAILRLHDCNDCRTCSPLAEDARTKRVRKYPTNRSEFYFLRSRDIWCGKEALQSQVKYEPNNLLESDLGWNFRQWELNKQKNVLSSNSITDTSSFSSSFSSSPSSSSLSFSSSSSSSRR